ncbi:hypothetical protein MTP99_004643 [Tenebrio molitor]|nr:hypothetical protein MTP99_004643 [Tenebrio molitor]
MADMTRDGIVVGFCGVSDFSRRNESRWNGIVWRESLTTNDKEFASKSNAPFTCENQSIPKITGRIRFFTTKNMQDEVMSSFKENSIQAWNFMQELCCPVAQWVEECGCYGQCENPGLRGENGKLVFVDAGNFAPRIQQHQKLLLVDGVGGVG